MRTKGKRAVIATAFGQDGERIRAQLEAIGFEEIKCVDDGLKALAAVREMNPDALIADAVLPSLEGAALIGRIHEMPLTVVPAAVLMVVPGMRICGESEFPYAALEKTADAEALERALESMSPENRPIGSRMRERAESILISLGVPEHPGRDYLLRAILIARQDARLLSALTTRLYPAVAETFGTDRRHVERAMRYAIDAAWKSGEMEAQYRIFGDTIDARRGNPTCGEMIAQIADILRWEGNA